MNINHGIKYKQGDVICKSVIPAGSGGGGWSEQLIHPGPAQNHPLPPRDGVRRESEVGGDGWAGTQEINHYSVLADDNRKHWIM